MSSAQTAGPETLGHMSDEPQGKDPSTKKAKSITGKSPMRIAMGRLMRDKIAVVCLATVVFFVLLTPLALLSRLFRKDQFYKSTDRESYFIERDHPYGADDIQHPW